MIYKFKRTPYAHQKDAIRKLLATGYGGALLMAPRTGKTKTMIDYACILHELGLVNRVLVSCPLAVLGVWEAELAANVPDRIRWTVTIWDKDNRKNGMPLPKWGKDRLDWVLINHDAFSTAGRAIGKRADGSIKRSRTRGGRYDMKKAFILWQPQLVAIDESHRFKSSASAKWRTMRSILWDIRAKEARVPFRVIMTGTPITKKKRIFDIYAQWKLLNPDRFAETFDEFKHHYGRWISKGSYEMWVGNREHEVQKLRALIHMDSFAVTRDECFDLPHAGHQIVPVELDSYTKEVYDKMAEEMVAQLRSGEITEASIALVQIMRLAQIASGIARTVPTPDELARGEKGKLIRIGNEKADALESILSDLFEADEKVVVAARFTHDIEAARAVCQKLKVPVFVIQGRRKDPNQSRVQRNQSIADFRTMDGPACFIAHPASGSMGIDLSTASTLVWYSLTPSWVDYTQMNDRIALNPHAVSIMYLIASPIDQVLYETLKEDGEVARAVVESPERLLRNYKAASSNGA